MQPLFIGPYQIGAQQDLKPFMLPEEAFPVLTNAYVWRGRVKKKEGFSLLGRLRRVLTAASAGNYTTINGTNTFSIFSGIGVAVTEPDASMVPGSTTNITIAFAAPISQSLTDTLGTGTMTVVGAGSITAATINYATGVVTITATAATGPAATTITGAYYPGLPVMGLLNRELTTKNSEQTVAFDTKYAYSFAGGAWGILSSTLSSTWSGGDSDFFWGTNYWQDSANLDFFWVTNNNQGIHGGMITLIAGAAAGPPSTCTITFSAAHPFQINDTIVFVNMSGGVANLQTATVTAVPTSTTIDVSNPGTGVFTNGAFTGLAVFNTIALATTTTRFVTGQNGIRYYNSASWFPFNPTLNTTTVLAGSLMLIPYKGRLIALNTLEGNTIGSATRFPQRARWSQIGDPTDIDLSWRDDTVGRGSFEDAATNEQIVSANIIKDTLIVYFERSTWRLVDTGNEVQPFQWQKINSELGAESTFSNVTFDQGLVAVGNVGVHVCNTQAVERIDSTIPDVVFQISNSSNGPERVYAARDFFRELVYFTYPDNDATKFPNKVLVYNYRNDSFAFFNESFTCYGNFQRTTGYTWATLPFGHWYAWNEPWFTGTDQALFLDIIAGNQQGFTFILNPGLSSNAQSRQIQAVSVSGTGPYTISITSSNHNVEVGDYILIENCIGSSGSDMTVLNGDIFYVDTVTTNSFTIQSSSTPLPAGLYVGGGTFSVISNVDIRTKMFNPFWANGRRYRLKRAEFLFDRTDSGEVTCNVYANTDQSITLSNPNTLPPVPSGVLPAILGDNAISTAANSEIPYQAFQEQIWQRMYYYLEGETFQIQFTFDDAQMRNPFVNQVDLTLHGMILHFEPAGTFQ
jgi:hypothetical protein